jgi:molybdate transport system permease protein
MRLPDRIRQRGRMRRAPWFAIGLWLTLALALCFLALPVLAIFIDSAPGRVIASLGDPQARAALRLSLETSTISVAVIALVGTPVAYLLATRRFPGKVAAVTLLQLPLVLPPAVAGIGLLAALGPEGVLGGALKDTHIQLVLQRSGVVVALLFVASPFYLRGAQAAFAAVDRSQLEAAQALGVSEARTFARIAIPLALPGLLIGLALAWARALGEFGATLMFAGSFQGVTQTAPLAIYDQFATNLNAALALSVVLVIVSASLLLAVELLSSRTG